MTDHRHEPGANERWFTTSPTSSWNSYCRECGHRIVLVSRAGGSFWRAVGTAPRFNYGKEYTG